MSGPTDWMKSIPPHWSRKKLKYVASLKSGDSITSDAISESGEYPVYGGNGIRGYTSAYTHCGEYVLIGRQGALCGNINYASGCFWASEHAVVVDIKGEDEVVWLGELLRSSLEIPVPPLHEQRAIADYLNRETARMDALVTAKERLLGLLAEKRRALITRAVTRGLDSHVPLRHSGISWLGEIPSHWELIPLRFLVDIIGGATPDTGKAELWDGDIPWVSPKDMKRDEISDAEDHVSVLALSSSALRLVDPVAVLIVVRRMILAHSFPTAVTTQPITVNQDIKALRCCELLEPRYLRDFLQGIEARLVSITEESAHGTRKLESEVLGRCQVCVPPIKEQRAIVAYIATETAKLDALRAATERTITLLMERRAALIAAAVTGQLAVEGAAVPYARQAREEVCEAPLLPVGRHCEGLAVPPCGSGG